MNFLHVQITPSYFNNIVKIIFYTSIFFFSIFLLERVGIIFSYHGQLAGIDNNFDYAIIRSIAGYSLYPNPNHFPYAVNPYAPLYFLFCQKLALLANIPANHTIAIYRISRSVALLADIGTLCILYKWLLRICGRKLEAATIVVLFFSVLCILGYTFNRSDAFFLFFYCLTLFVLFKSEAEIRWKKPLLIAFLSLLCIFSKQNGISLLALCSIYFYCNKQFVQLLLFLSFSLVFCGAAFYYFEAIYTNHFFAQHVVHSLRNRIDPQWFYVNIFKALMATPIIFPLSIAFILSCRQLANKENKNLSILAAIFLAQLCFSVLLCFKWGSSLGYFNESFFLSAIIIVGGIKNYGVVFQERKAKVCLATLYPVLVFFLTHIALQLFLFFVNNPTTYKIKYQEQLAAATYLQQTLKKTGNYVIDLYQPDYDFFKNILYAHMAAPNFDAVNCCTLPDKSFNYEALMQGFSTGKIEFIIAGRGFLPTTFWNTSLKHYQLDTSFSTYSIYKFNAATP
jgi:hypothetical protein